MRILNILVGILLLTLGRQLFWLFVGGVGFITAMELAARWATAWPAWLTVVVALSAGIIGTLLAIFLQEIAVGIAGFFAGGYAILGLTDVVGLQAPVLVGVLTLIGAIAGLVLALALFDWALIVLSSMSGAAVLVQSLELNPPLALIFYIGAAALGNIIQAGLMRTQSPQRELRDE